MPSQLAQRIGQRIYTARTQSGLTQADLGRLAGLADSQVSRLERGLVGNPQIATLRRIARALGMTYEDLVAADGSDAASELQAALVDLTGDPHLANVLADLTGHWALLSRSARQRILHAIAVSRAESGTEDEAASDEGHQSTLDPLQLLSLEEAASLLHVRYRTVQRIIGAGDLQVMTWGTVSRVYRAEVERFMHARTTRPPSPSTTATDGSDDQLP